jgi:hypothetical protein
VSKLGAGQNWLVVRHTAAAPAVDVRAGGKPVFKGLTNPEEAKADAAQGEGAFSKLGTLAIGDRIDLGAPRQGRPVPRRGPRALRHDPHTPRPVLLPGRVAAIDIDHVWRAVQREDRPLSGQRGGDRIAGLSRITATA